MSRATNDLAAVRMMLGPGHHVPREHGGRSRVDLARLHARDQPAHHARTRCCRCRSSASPCGSSATASTAASRQSGAVLDAVARACRRTSPGVRVVRAFAHEERGDSRRSSALNQDYLGKNLRLIRTSGLFHPTLAFLSGPRGAARALPRRPRGDRGPNHARPVRRVHRVPARCSTGPCTRCGWVINLFQRGMRVVRPHRRAARRRTRRSRAARTRDRSGARAAARLEFRDLTSPIPGADRAVASHRSACAGGSTVALVGHTGSGKSTAARADRARARSAAGHRVRSTASTCASCDLCVAADADRAAPRRTTFLFSETVAENIAYGVDRARHARRSSARSQHRAPRRRRAPVSPAATRRSVGERGITLSGGQRQRAAHRAPRCCADRPGAAARRLPVERRHRTPRRRSSARHARERAQRPHDAARLASREHGARRRRDPRARGRRDRRAAAPTIELIARSAAATPSWYASSSSKRSSRRRERARR